MKTAFSMARLAAGCFALLWGASWAFGPVTPEFDRSGLRVWGYLIGAIGLSMALQETAYIHAQFLRAADRPAV